MRTPQREKHAPYTKSSSYCVYHATTLQGRLELHKKLLSIPDA